MKSALCLMALGMLAACSPPSSLRVTPVPIPLVNIAPLGQKPVDLSSPAALDLAPDRPVLSKADRAVLAQFDSSTPLPPAPADHLFQWSDIQAQMKYGQDSHLRQYSISRDEWDKALTGYLTTAIPVIAKKAYATPELLQALRSVPRPFLAYNYQTDAPKTRILEDYGTIIDVGYGATMSAPSIQAFMTAQLHPRPDMTALEIGTGSGSQSVLLSYLVKTVYTIEVREALGTRVSHLLRAMGYGNIHTRIGDGYYGWKEKAPFDIIIVTCQANHIPPALVDQLKPDGVMIIPVGPAWSPNQQMFKVWKDPQTGRIVSKRVLAKTRFIPMLGTNMENK